jgi:hypothetical protein
VARALACPLCGHRHPIESLPDSPTFSCEGCGRTLKTPARARRPAGESEGAEQPRRRSTSSRGSREDARDAGTTLLPRAEQRAAAGPRRAPSWLRVLAWFLAVPLAAVVVIGGANVFGLLTGSQLTDMFLEARFTAYGRLIALLPVWALAAALLVTAADRLWVRRVRKVRRRASDDAE